MVSDARIKELAQQAGNEYEQPHNPARTFTEACESIERAIRTALAEQREEDARTDDTKREPEDLIQRARGRAAFLRARGGEIKTPELLETLAATIERLEHKLLEFDLDRIGIESRNREAVELVDLRAAVKRLEAERDEARQDARKAWLSGAQYQERAEAAEAERDELATENALCRDAVEDALDLIGLCESDDRNSDDGSLAAARAKAAEDENAELRGLLGNSALPCPYCGLPAEEQARCAYGFPGCSRADDQMLSRHFADGWRADQYEKENAKLREALRKARGLALATLNAALRWNDHNFDNDAPHAWAKRAADEAGFPRTIAGDKAAEEWLASIDALLGDAK
jgi:hypothetical protein